MKKKRNLLYHFLRNTSCVLMKIIYRPKVIGKNNIPKEGALILAGNHKHAFDPIMAIMGTRRQVHFLAKEFLFKGFHGWIFRKVGLIEVHTTNRNQNVNSVRKAEEILNNGEVIGIFPEGTRNRTNQELLRFKHGTVTMAQKTNTKILPFAIRGKYKFFGNKLEIEFGTPIDVSNMEVEEANEYLRNEVLKLLRKRN